MQVAGYTVLWPPQTYLREEPLRLVGPDEARLAEVGQAVRITGAAKEPADYRYFADKVHCPAPYWGAAEVRAD